MRRYAKFLVGAGILVAVLGVLIVNLNDNLVYGQTPSEVVERPAGDARLRLGGQVVPDSVERTATETSFLVTDGRVAVPVRHVGAPPDLFQPGIGVVVEGSWDGETFRSDTMLVKHDENYSPEDPERPFTSP